jgi:3-isopropylmalate dehydrogenase
MPESSTQPSKRIAIIPGDGIGKEVVPEAVKVVKSAASAEGHDINIIEFDWSADRYLRDGTTLPSDAPEMLRRDFDAILLGALGDSRVPDNRHGADILMGLRFKLDLYANVRPCRLLDRRLTPLRNREEKDIQFTVIRENTEGAYVGMGGFFKKGTADEIATQEDVNTRKGVERILRFAFEYARKHACKRLCMSDKSNALAYGHDLWQRTFAEVKREYPDIESSHMFIDNLLMQMVRDPSQFDVIVTCNLFGDIASDVGAQLAGGLGLAPSGNIHPGQVSMFEPVHGSAPTIAGKRIANPMGAILAAAMMLNYVGLAGASRCMNKAVRYAISEGKTTPDLGGSLGTREVGDWLARKVESA